MGTKHSEEQTDTTSSAPRSSTLTAEQASRLQRLFSRGLHPDVSLLPYQMRRMKVDAPPKTKENRKTIRMKNICHMNKKTFTLKHLADNRYIVSFEYSTTLDVYCSIYFFVTEATDKYNVTQQFDEKYKRCILDHLPAFDHTRPSPKLSELIDEQNSPKNEQHELDDDVKSPLDEQPQEEEHKYDAAHTEPTYIGTTYLLRKGYNITFEQNEKDYMDLNAVNYRFFQENPALGYYPIIVEFSLTKPAHSLLCIQHRDSEEEDTDPEIISKPKEDGVQYITKSMSYAKLILGANNLYSSEIMSQKTQVKNRAFEAQDIYGLDCPTDPYSKEDNLCVICMTMPRDTALSPCRHLCMCSSCASQLLKRSNKCPICRSYVSETIKISAAQKQNSLVD